MACEPIPVGTAFGRWVTISERIREQSPAGLWVQKVACRCICGAESIVSAPTLLKGKSQSCGCLRKELMSARRITHGKSRNPSAEYKVWVGMKKRCTNPKDTGYRNYGGRGISVSPKWAEDFVAFWNDMGDKPSPKYDIDRIDVNGDYCPENCRWVTKKVNANNRRNNVRHTFNGKTLTIAEWADLIGVPYATLAWRMSAGWPLSRALGQVESC